MPHIGVVSLQSLTTRRCAALLSPSRKVFPPFAIALVDDTSLAAPEQAAFRGMDNRVVLRERAEAAARLQAVMRGQKTRDRTDEEIVKFRAAAKLQAVW